MSNDPKALEHAIKKNDAMELLRSASPEELERLKQIEELLALTRARRKNTALWSLISSGLVGVVAVTGMLVNSYQSYTARQAQQQQQQVDQDRWSKEFLRAQRADKYRAFFEISVLATDPSNPDKRLVGYALLQEFVADADYNSKATLMLEESLGQELRSKENTGLDEQHRTAVVAIVDALSKTTECHALERAAHSIDKVTLHHAKEGSDLDEVLEIYRIYVRRLVGRATLTCKTLRDFADVRKPLIDAVQRMPELGGAMVKLATPVANARVARLLVEVCNDESSISGLSDCESIFQHYTAFCAEPGVGADEAEACGVVKEATVELAKAAAAPPQR